MYHYRYTCEHALIHTHACVSLSSAWFHGMVHTYIVCIFAYISIHVYRYVNTHQYTHTHVRTPTLGGYMAHIFVCVYLHKYPLTCAHIWIQTHTRIDACAPFSHDGCTWHMYTNTYIAYACVSLYKCTDANTHKHTRKNLQSHVRRLHGTRILSVDVCVYTCTFLYACMYLHVTHMAHLYWVWMFVCMYVTLILSLDVCVYMCKFLYSYMYLHVPHIDESRHMCMNQSQHSD